MEANILCTLLAQRIPPEQFQLWGLDIHWMDEAYNTPENQAIVVDVIANYDTLEVEYLKAQEPTYEDLRRAEYPSPDELIVALWEQVIEGRPESAAILQAKREAVKIKFPKP